MKIRIIRFIIEWLWKHHKFLVMDVVVPVGKHIHKNGKRKKKLPNPALSGTNE
jgi:hypothetical protein